MSTCWKTDQQREILKLIKLYKKHECLWNINSEMFRRTDIKRSAYKQIAAEMGSNEDLIRRKIKNLRTSYTAKKKKLVSSKQSDADSDDAMSNSLFYFNEMSFLDPCIIYRKANITNMIISENSNTFDQEMLNDKHLLNDRDLHASQASNDWKGSIDQETECDELTDQAEICTPPPIKYEALSPHNFSTPNCSDPLTQFAAASVPTKSNSGQDEFDMFGHLLAAQLRKIPEIEAVQFMGSIQQQLSELRVRAILALRRNASKNS